MQSILPHGALGSFCHLLGFRCSRLSCGTKGLATKTKQVEVHMSAGIPLDAWHTDGPEDWDDRLITLGRNHTSNTESHQTNGGFFAGDSTSDTNRSPPKPRIVVCPHCASTRTRPLQWGRRLGGVMGSVAGAAGGAVAGCLTAPRLPSRPLQWVSLISSAVIGGLAAGSAGCRSGASLGDLLDDCILPNRRCLDCAKRFNHPTPQGQ